jgi:hypothetical protein
MKAIILVLFILVAIASVFQVAIGSPDFQGLKPWSSNSNMDTNSIEAKLSEALQSLKAAQESNTNDNPLNSSSINNLSATNLGLNKTAANSSATNSTETNSTAINSSDKDDAQLKAEGDSGAVSLSGSSSVSPQEVGSNSKASFNGFWGMEANQEGIGKSGVNSKTFLSGDFEVDKTVQFQDRGY